MLAINVPIPNLTIARQEQFQSPQLGPVHSQVDLTVGEALAQCTSEAPGEGQQTDWCYDCKQSTVTVFEITL